MSILCDLIYEDNRFLLFLLCFIRMVRALDFLKETSILTIIYSIVPISIAYYLSLPSDRTIVIVSHREYLFVLSKIE